MSKLFLLAVLLTVIPAYAQTPTLLNNPDFEADGLTGWPTVWARTEGAITATRDTAQKHGGQASLKVVHTGDKDWAVSQARRLAVAPGDILTLGVWAKADKVSSAEVSVITRAADDKVLDWSFAPAQTSGTHDWRELKRRFVVPEGCASIEVRFIGNGPGTIWFDDARLVREGSVNEWRRDLPKTPLTLENRFLTVRLQPQDGTLLVTDRRNGREWKQAASEGLIVQSAKAEGKDAARLELWDVANDLHLNASLRLAAEAPEIAVTLEGQGAVAQAVAFPGPFVTGAGTVLAIPLNEGVLWPVDDASVAPMQLVAYGGHGICMAWFGASDEKSGAGVMGLIGTPDDARIDIHRREGGNLAVRPLWEATRGEFGTARRLTYVFFDQGGYVAQAKRYRAYAQKIGLFKTLAQKRQENPNVDLLIGAANVWGWVPDKLALCREMKGLGLQRVLWSNGGSPDEIKQIDALGYLVGRYDIYQDVWATGAPKFLPTEGWPDDLVWLPNGDWMRGWAHHQKNPDGTVTIFEGGVINSARGLERAKKHIPEDLKTHPYKARFIDTTTASPWREDYNPAHPLTRSQDRAYKMALLDFISKDMKLVAGTETGIDASVPFVHYYEGMLSLGPYRLPDSGRDITAYKSPTPDFLKFQVGPFYRVPLWELVYHDCTVAQWYWGDGSNKAPEVWPQRDLINILTGTPPMFAFSGEQWQQHKARFVESYNAVCPVARRLGYDEMLSHAFLTPDHTVQQTRWQAGAVVTVNFGPAPYKLPDGQEIKPLGWLVQDKP